MFGHVPARSLAGWLLILLAAFGAPARTAADANWRAAPATTAIMRDDAQFQDRGRAKDAFVIPAKPPIPAPASSEPFGIDAVPVTSGELATRWRRLEIDIRAESKILARCRADTELCPSAAQNFLGIIAEGRARAGRARLAVINRAINLAIRPTSRLAKPQISDRWSAPVDTLSTGRGDCKNYAIAKYVALLQAGIAPDDVALVILRNLAAGEDHAVVAARLDGDWIVLDNRWFTLVKDSDMRRVVPLFVLNHDGVKLYAAQRPQPELAEMAFWPAFM